jgi:solute:Na+ symporter, SSS family
MNITVYDYCVIGFYLLFMFSLGPVYKSFSKTSSDYFRGGGTMLWWIVGVSAVMTGFSAMAFVGTAAKTYETGTFYLVLSGAGTASLIFMYFFTAAKYRRMRVVTAVEAVRDRFGKVNEQVFTWLLIPTFLIWGGVGLYAISVFMNGVFGFSMELTIISISAAVVGMTLLGGSWAATAGDFVQMLIVFSITALMAFLVLRHPDIGGFTGLIDKMPDYHFKWTGFARPGVLIFFIITLFFNQLMVMNSIAMGAAKYVFVKTGRDARKAVLLTAVGLVLVTPLLLIPPAAATVFFPDLNQGYGNLNNPNEAAYVAMAIKFLPQGLLGMLICAVFASSLTSMNSSLNTITATFVRNFYIEIIDKNASENRQIFIGRIFMLIFGVILVGVALIFKNIKGLQLFDLMIMVAASVNIPLSVPTFLGIFIKRTPSWAGWGTMVAGMCAAGVLRLFLNNELIDITVSGMFTMSSPLTARELGDLNIAITTAIMLLVCNGFFFFSMLFYHPDEKEKKRVDEFFRKMRTPVDIGKEHGPTYESDKRQVNVLGNLSMIYGAFIVLMVLIPNEMRSRLHIAVIAAVILGFGISLKFIGKKTENIKE